jgi:hypothetical protein
MNIYADVNGRSKTLMKIEAFPSQNRPHLIQHDRSKLTNSRLVGESIIRNALIYNSTVANVPISF